MRIFLTALVALAVIGGDANAQQSNDQYFQEQQQRQQQAHIAEQNRQGYMNQQDQEAQQPAGEWKSTWGAVATDGPAGILGAATQMESETSAKSAALAECKSKGGNPCKVEASYANQCTALVTGNSRYIIKMGSSEQEASGAGMQTCSSDDVNCHVYYVACSRPQFVRY